MNTTPGADLKQVMYNNKGYLSREKMTEALDQILASAKILKELHNDPQWYANPLDALTPKPLESADIDFSLWLISADIPRSAVSGSAGKSLAKAITDLATYLRKSAFNGSLELSAWDVEHVHLGVTCSLGVEIGSTITTVESRLDGSEVETEVRKCLFQELVAAGKFPLEVSEANGRVEFKDLSTGKIGRGGSPVITAEHLMGLPSLAEELTQATSPVSNHLKGRLAETTIALLRDYRVTNFDPKPVKAALMPDLNRVIRDQSLYDAHRFAHVVLRPETQRLLGQNPRGEELQLLNRMLLEDAYPLKISRCNVGSLVVNYEQKHTEQAISSFLVACANKSLRFKTLSFVIRGDDNSYVTYPKAPELLGVLDSARIPFKQLELNCSWSLKRWRAWPALLDGANYYGKFAVMMAFEAEMPSGKRFQLELSATPQKGYKFKVCLDSRDHVVEFRQMTTAKLMDTPFRG